MSKYQPLAIYLRRQKGEEVILTLSEIERLLSRMLPKASARAAWWTADATSRQPQQKLLAESGFQAQLDSRREAVRFTRLAPDARNPRVGPSDGLR